MKNETLEIHCLFWSSNNYIGPNGCYTDLERAKRHMKYANSRLSKWRKLFVHRWKVKTLHVKIGERS